MNSPAPTLHPLTGDLLVDGLTNGSYWLLDSNRTLSWALADFGPYQWSATSPALVALADAKAWDKWERKACGK
jgi:hypothetical protein